MIVVGWVTSPRSVGWNKRSRSPERLGWRPIWWWFCDIQPWGGIIVWWVEVDGIWNPWMVFDWCVIWYPTFIILIWHGGEWLKRDLAQPFYGRVECGSPISGWLIAFINEKSIPLIPMCKFGDVYVDFDGWYVYCIYVPIILVICTFYDTSYVWLLACFYLYMNG